MFYIRTDKVTYNRINTLLPDIRPDIKITLISCDDNLEKLGFCDSAPCVVSFDLNSDELENLLDELMYMEISAYNTENGKHPSDNDPDYQIYRKYGWMWDIFFYAEERKEQV